MQDLTPGRTRGSPEDGLADCPEVVAAISASIKRHNGSYIKTLEEFLQKRKEIGREKPDLRPHNRKKVTT